MKKPSGARNRKLKRQKEELDRSFDLLCTTVPHLKKFAIEENDDLVHLAKYRESGYNTNKIQSSNALRKKITLEKIAYIQSKYSASNYPNKKTMYIDIAEKENIKPRTAMKYMTMIIGTPNKRP